MMMMIRGRIRIRIRRRRRRRRRRTRKKKEEEEESANLKTQNVFHGRNNITCTANFQSRTAATLYTLEA